MNKPPSPSEKPEIGVRNLQRKLHVDIPALRTFAERALTTCLAQRPIRETPLHKLRQISVLLISDRRMKALHRRFLGKSASTDVITFDHGEIFISTETARNHARIFNTSTLHEIQLYIVHGLLHLQGFDDRNTADARKMEEAQARILEEIASGRRSGDC